MIRFCGIRLSPSRDLSTEAAHILQALFGAPTGIQEGFGCISQLAQSGMGHTKGSKEAEEEGLSVWSRGHRPSCEREPQGCPQRDQSSGSI